MKNNCFYFGTFSPDGYSSLVRTHSLGTEHTLTVDGQSAAAKQQLFSALRAELEKRNISYTDLCVANGSAGVLCDDGSFKLVDSVYCADGEKTINIDPDLSEKLKRETSVLKDEKNKHLLRAERFLTSCGSVVSDLQRLEGNYINHAKINRFTSGLWKKISRGMKGCVGTETVRRVTTLTSEGVELNMEAFDIYCERLVVLVDRTGACSRIITDRLRRYALGAGYDIISCPCLFSDNAEHLIIPELHFGIFTSKHYHRAEFENCRKVYAKRFCLPTVDEVKRRIDFSLKVYKSLMNEVFVSLENAESCERKIDTLILGETDLQSLTKKLLSLLPCS